MDGEPCSKADYPEQKAGGCRLPRVRGEQTVTVSNTGNYPLEIASMVASSDFGQTPHLWGEHAGRGQLRRERYLYAERGGHEVGNVGHGR